MKNLTQAPTSSDTAATHRILIIEDHVDSAESMSAILKLRGHQVIIAGDGPAALAEVQIFHPDVVLCDISLPGEMDGYAVASALRADPTLGRCRLIAVSGYGSDEDIRRALQSGFDVHLLKPINIDVLLDEVPK